MMIQLMQKANFTAFFLLQLLQLFFWWTTSTMCKCS